MPRDAGGSRHRVDRPVGKIANSYVLDADQKASRRRGGARARRSRSHNSSRGSAPRKHGLKLKARHFQARRQAVTTMPAIRQKHVLPADLAHRVVTIQAIGRHRQRYQVSGAEAKRTLVLGFGLRSRFALKRAV